MKTICFILIYFTIFSAKAQWQPINSSTSDVGNIYHLNGNVGIGTSNPLGPLHIYKMGSNAWIYFQNNLNGPSNPSNNSGLSFGWNYSGGQGESIINYSSSSGASPRLAFTSFNGTSLNEEMTLAGGKVGIGNSIPLEKLDLHGNFYMDNVSAGTGNHFYWATNLMTFGTRPGDYFHNIFKLSPGGSSSGLLFSRLEMYNANSPTSFEQRVQIHTNDISYFNGGNVLIGKTSQINSGYKLDVNGSGRFNEIVVNTTGADYVFEASYNLPSLEELNAYIRVNKHLPEVPSACVMEENGVNLGEMNILLLKKVEELTLYMIEMKKENEIQKTQNEKQEREIELLKNKIK